MSDYGESDLYTFDAELYDHVVPYRERQDISFFVDAAIESGGPVLEIGCGTGRVLIPTARAGIQITGLDMSTHMLAVCRRKLLEEAPDVQSRVLLVQADMRSFHLSSSFRLVTSPFRPFQHLQSVEDQLACLECVRRHLLPGGRLILDLFNPSLHFLTQDNLGQEFGDEPEFTMPDGRRVTRFQKIVARDYFNQVNHVELIYYVSHPDGRQERLVDAFPMRYLFRFEAEHLLVRAGFELEQVFGDYDKSPFGAKYPGELLLVARKP